jgi:uncharacterized protein (DUF305 family)
MRFLRFLFLAVLGFSLSTSLPAGASDPATNPGEAGTAPAKKEKPGAKVKPGDPIDVMVKHLKAIMKIVRKAKKRNQEDCKKIMARLAAYRRKIEPEIKKMRKSIKAMPEKKRKSLNKRYVKVMNWAMNRFEKVLLDFDEKCPKYFHDLDAFYNFLVDVGRHEHESGSHHH